MHSWILNKRNLVFLVVIFLFGCASKLVGQYDPTNSLRACNENREYCQQEFELGKIEYDLDKLQDGAYRLEGSFLLHREAMLRNYSANFSKIKRVKLDFVFFKDHYIVHEQSFYVSGEYDEEIPFSGTLKTRDQEIESAFFINFSGSITVTPW